MHKEWDTLQNESFGRLASSAVGIQCLNIVKQLGTSFFHSLIKYIVAAITPPSTPPNPHTSVSARTTPPFPFRKEEQASQVCQVGTTITSDNKTGYQPSFLCKYC